MSTRSNNLVNPNAREAMNRFKMEAAGEVGVNLKQGYNGDLTSRAGRLRRRPDGQEDDRGLRERHEVSESFKKRKAAHYGRLFAFVWAEMQMLRNV